MAALKPIIYGLSIWKEPLRERKDLDMRKVIIAVSVLALMLLALVDLFTNEPKIKPSLTQQTPLSSSSPTKTPSLMKTPQAISTPALHLKSTPPAPQSFNFTYEEGGKDLCSVHAVVTPTLVFLSGNKRSGEKVKATLDESDRELIVAKVDFANDPQDSTETWRQTLFSKKPIKGKSQVKVDIQGCGIEPEIQEVLEKGLFTREAQGDFSGYIKNAFEKVAASQEDVYVSVGGYNFTIPRRELTIDNSESSPFWHYSGDDGFSFIIQKEGFLAMGISMYYEDGKLTHLIQLPTDGLILISIGDETWELNQP